MNEEYQLRPVTAGDDEFLCRVYASTREDVAMLDWGDDEKEKFVRMQFQAQSEHYAAHYPQARFDVILLGGEPVGRLYVDRREDEIWIIDIALLRNFRGRGIGGRIMQRLLDEAARVRKPLRIHVLRGNRARRIYDRLGFKKTDDTGVYELLEWTPPASDAKNS